MAADLPIPVYTNLKDLYDNLGISLNHVLADRWSNLAEEFERRFRRKPAYIARAPGRVNLIGEHIDYALFGVFPAAIEQDILIACSPRPMQTRVSEERHAPGSVTAENLHAKYARKSFAPAHKISLNKVGEDEVHAGEWYLDINIRELRWENYVKAGYLGVLNHYFKLPDASTVYPSYPVPVDLLVTGSVPAGSGLSSSAAMVVASTLAFLAVNGKLDARVDNERTEKPWYPLSKGELVRMTMENEKRVGVNSGGMDQAASVMSSSSSALYITFYPSLKASPVPLPARSVFVCANSLVVADKAASAKHRYNLRVVETLVSARILAKVLGVQVGESEKVTLREVVGRLMGEAGGEEIRLNDLRRVLKRMIREVEALKQGRGSAENEEFGVTMEEMIKMSGLSEDVFRDVYLSWLNVEAIHFQLYKRAKHVYSEALRVLEFHQICVDAAEANSSDTSSVLESLGSLMNKSQTSCAELFECSCPELNELTQLAREAGAHGSRLTGAGWGGCTVSLVAEDRVDSFIKKMQKTYAPYEGLEGHALHEVIFATRPAAGACVYRFT